MGNRNVTISIDEAVHEEIKAKGLNVSGLCESALREINHSFTHTSDPSSCTHKFTWPFSVPSGLAKECLKCGTFKRVYLEKDPIVS